MNDEELLRYSRQIMLPEMDVNGQQKLINSSVLIVGMGGLGCPVAMYLVAAGVGNITIADDDVLELNNLQRQIAHSQAILGELKVESAERILRGLNPNVNITTINKRLSGNALREAIKKVDFVVDCCDNFDTRFAINGSCLLFSKPLVSGTAIRMEGQVAVFDYRDINSPCYQCLYQEVDNDGSCSTNGVMAPVVGIIGSMQAMETIKLISEIGRPLVGRVLLLDASVAQWREVRLLKDPDCKACGGL